MPGLWSRVKNWDTQEILTAADLNAEFNNVITQSVPAQFDDYSLDAAQSNEQSDPGEVGSETLATSLALELKQIRFMISEVSGETKWRTSPATSLSLLATGAKNAHIGLEFEGKLGGASTTTDVLAKFINQGGIINASSLTSADVAAGDFGTTNVKFGTYSYSLASGNILAFPGQHGNPVKGSISAWFRNLAAGDYIAYNPLLGLELYLDGTGLQTWKVTEKTASAEDTKNTTTVAGSVSRAGDTTFRNVTAKWRLNDEGGASTDLFEMEREGSDEGTQVTGDNIDISVCDGGVWFFGAKRNDPSWDHFYAASGLPSAHSDAWTKTGTFSETASPGSGILNMSGTLSGAQHYAKTNNIDLTQFTLEFKMKVNALVREANLENRFLFKIQDTAVDRGIFLTFTDKSIIVGDTSAGALSGGNAPREIQLDTTKFHTYRLGVNGGGGADSDVNCTLYIDGRAAAKWTNAETDTTATGILFGQLDTGTVEFDVDIESIAYFDAGETAPVAASSQGELDSIGVVSDVISDTTVTLLQTKQVTSVFQSEPNHGVSLPLVTFDDRTAARTTTSSTYEDIGQAVYYVAGDGVTEIEFEFGASVKHGTAGQNVFLNVDIDGDVTGLDNSAWPGARINSNEADDSVHVLLRRNVVLSPGLHEARPNWRTPAGTGEIVGEDDVFWSCRVRKHNKL